MVGALTAVPGAPTFGVDRSDGTLTNSLEPSWLQALDGATCPLVVSGHEVPGLNADVVQIDNERGGAMAAAHLLRLGHKRFGCITGSPELDPSRDRLQGFRDAVQEAGGTIDEGAVVASDFTTAGGYRAGLELLRSGMKFTALFVQSDMMAIGVLRAAGELGISVPGQLSVVGFDDIELSRFLFPALTTIGMPLRQVGEEASRVHGGVGVEPHLEQLSLSGRRAQAHAFGPCPQTGGLQQAGDGGVDLLLHASQSVFIGLDHFLSHARCRDSGSIWQ